jgi:hypothetical protein
MSRDFRDPALLPQLEFAIQLLPIMVVWLCFVPVTAAFTLSASRVKLQPRAAASSSEDAGMRDKYLSRLGVDAAIVDRAPNADDLQILLTAHLQSIPFENLGQHEHPSEGLPFIGTPAVSRPLLPTLDVDKCLSKLVEKNRGGFCFELNFSFAWLLRQLGYSVRLGRADVFGPPGTPPNKGHLVIYVDGLGADPLLVDPGFGDAIRTVFSVRGKGSDPALGEKYNLAPSAGFGLEDFGLADRFSHVLMRERSVGSATAFFDIVGAPPPPPEPMPPIPVYAINLEDDLPYDSPEFVEGLAAVLDEDPEKNIFQAKRSAPASSSLRLVRSRRWRPGGEKTPTSTPSTRRVLPAGLCVLAKDNGHVMLGKDYIKTVERGVEVSRTELPTEKEWRDALEANFGITL